MTSSYLHLVKADFKLDDYRSFGSKAVRVVGSAATFYLAYKIVRSYLNKRRYKNIPGPALAGPMDYLMGVNGQEFAKMTENGKSLPDILTEWREKYGETFKFFLFHDAWVCTTNKDIVKELFITNESPKDYKTSIPFAYPLGERFIGRGLVSELDHETWKRRRAIFNPGFHRHVLDTFVEQFNQKADMLVERLRTMADGKTLITLFTEINHATVDAIAQIAFGMTIDSINQTDTEFSEAIAYILKMQQYFAQDMFVKYKPSKWAAIKEFKQKIRYLRDVGRRILADRVKAIENQEAVPDDILTNILKSCKEENLDEETMIDDFVTFFIAGQETTANTLAFCFIELGRHPRVWEKVKEEVDRVVGEKGVISHHEIPELKYCSAVFKESLRLWPPVPFLTRRTITKMNVGGHDIPLDTVIIASTYLNARTEKYFRDPLEFRPERFMPESEYFDPASKDIYVYFPFSLGSRNCIGQTFAQMEGVLMIAKLVQRFDLTLDPNQSFDPVLDTTLRPKDGTKCYLTIRSKH